MPLWALTDSRHRRFFVSITTSTTRLSARRSFEREKWSLQRHYHHSFIPAPPENFKPLLPPPPIAFGYFTRESSPPHLFVFSHLHLRGSLDLITTTTTNNNNNRTARPLPASGCCSPIVPSKNSLLLFIRHHLYSLVPIPSCYLCTQQQQQGALKIDVLYESTQKSSCGSKPKMQQNHLFSYY